MALKAILKSLEDAPEEVRGLYKEEGDVFVLDLDGVEEHPKTRALKSALDGERKSRADANKKAEKLSAEIEKFKDIDPEKAREAMLKLQELDDKQMIDEGKLDELLEQRTERMRSDFEAQKTALEKARDESDARAIKLSDALSTEMVDNRIMAAAAKAGVKDNALDDVLNRARSIWKVTDDGKPVAYSGDTQLFGKNGSDPLGMEEWMEDLAGKADHLFQPNKGGGAGNDGGSQNNGAVKTIPRSEASQHLEEIASGEMQIAD